MSVDPSVLKAIAGVGKIPAVGSLVYYFPQGHVEQSAPSANLSAISISKPFALCKVSTVNLLASADMEEVFVKIQLDPIADFNAESVFIGCDFGKDVASFAKILTPSDANNGGGFSVPRFCADSIFPKLDFEADPPLQTLTVTDVHGKSWEFRHIYRGTPRRHLLTTGWSKFVNSKKLVAGDSIVFVKDSDEKLFVGVRRAGRFIGKLDGLRLEGGFSRNLKDRFLTESVVEAIKLMDAGRTFEVVYYPRMGMSEFVVEKEVVDRVRGVCWVEGMRVKMAVATEDSLRTTWFQGTVRRSDVKDSGPWANSPWQMLQVTWDDPEVLQNVRAVSPWQLEIVSPSPHLQAPFPALKKVKVQECLEFPSEGCENVFYPRSDANGMVMGNFTALLNYPTSPAGMQGARQNFFVPSLPNFVHWNTHHLLADKTYGINKPEGLKNSESDAASAPSQETMHTSRLEAASTPSQDSTQNDSLEHFGVADCNPTRKVSKGSIQLFGQIIHMEQPDGASVDRKNAENNGAQSLDFSLSFPHLRLLGVPHQRISAVEACSL